MPQQLTYPIRNGLQIPRGEMLTSVEVFSEGGLDLTQSVLETRPGCASALTNFEVSLTGGYRRINGYYYYSNTIVPGEGPILGVAVYFPGTVIAARKDVGVNTYSVYVNSGITWTEISTTPLNYLSGMVIQYCAFNWNGTHKLVFTDGVNYAYTWNGTTFTLLNGAGSASNPQVSCIFNGYLFVSGYSSNYGAVKISAPLDETDWNPVDGAAEVVIGDAIVALKTWRDQLIIFCKRSIYKITGNSTDPAASSPFTVQPVTTTIGCVASRTVQECDGDVIYLSQDGMRTISGTFNIGDTEIASISRPIQSIIAGIDPTSTALNALVIRKKTQYRLFFGTSGDGIIGSIRRFRDGHEGWEWGQLAGFANVNCCTSGYINSDHEIVIHGGTDGYVYRQEVGNSLNGTPINEIYTTVPLELGDRGLRKVIQRVTVYIAFEGSSPNILLSLIYDYSKTGVIQPDPYNITGDLNPSLYGTAIFGTSTYSEAGPPIVRQLVQGSGFIVQLEINTVNQNIPPYIIQGYYIEAFPGPRR